jgi:hypothetical protein
MSNPFGHPKAWARGALKNRFHYYILQFMFTIFTVCSVLQLYRQPGLGWSHCLIPLALLMWLYLLTRALYAYVQEDRKTHEQPGRGFDALT